MPYTGKLTRKASCAICKTSMPRGELVYFDGTKRQGSHLAHTKCWDDLRASRPRPKYDLKADAKPQVSTEPLDAPF